MSTKGPSNMLEQQFASSFLLGEMRYDRREFKMEISRVGLKFLSDKVSPKNRERFTAAFDDLVRLGCLPETLASTLYCFCKMYSSITITIPPLGEVITFPPQSEIKKIRSDLRKAIEGINRVGDYGVIEVLARIPQLGDPPSGRDQVMTVLNWYVDALSIWSAPRKDILKSCAPTACCLYPKLATRHFQFKHVAVLLECLGYRPDPRRQMKPMYRRDISDLCDLSLERNFRNFGRAYPIFEDRLQADLKSEHQSEENRSLEVSDSWIAGRDFPPHLFSQLRPNQFDWAVVFAPPQGNRKALTSRRTNARAYNVHR